MQDINKSFGGVIDLCAYDFFDFFSESFDYCKSIFQDFTNSLFSQNP